MQLRNGETTLEDWKDIWNRNCSVEGIGQQRSNEFIQDPSILRIYSDHEDCIRENKKNIKQLNHPTMWLQAGYDGLPGNSGSDKSAKACGELKKKKLLLFAQSKAMLGRNPATQWVCWICQGDSI